MRSERRYRRRQFAITGVKQLALTAEGVLSCTTASSAEKSRGAISEAVVPRERPGSIVVMATHGRSGIAHLFLGSVAEAVVRKANCPVLTICREQSS